MVAPTLLGQRCWVRWPYLQEAIVQGVSDKGEKVSIHEFLDGVLCIGTLTAQGHAAVDFVSPLNIEVTYLFYR